MDILKSLEQANWIQDYEIQDFKQWSEGTYYKLKITFIDKSVLFVREYMDEFERNYFFHWQDKSKRLIMRWDNAPHHHAIATFPHHKHDCNEKIIESKEITINEVIKIIETKVIY